MTKGSKGEQRRTRKRREHKNKSEMLAFRHGLEAGRDIVAEEMLKRAIRRGLAWGCGVGALLGTVATYLVLR